MSTLSPRCALTLMADSDFVSPFVVSGNSSKLDVITSVEQATSTTRPSPAFDGQHIYETDTQNFRRYDLASNAWYLLGSGPNGSAAQGLVGSFSNTSAAVLTGTTGPNNYAAVSMLDYNFSVVSGKMYKIIEQGWYNVTGSPAQLVQTTEPIEAYTLVKFGSQPALTTTTALHYTRHWYNKNKWGTRVPVYKAMLYAASSTGTLYLRSCLRTNTTFWTTTTSIGRPSDTIGTYAWAYDMGPSGLSY